MPMIRRSEEILQLAASLREDDGAGGA
jgi:hypothetical protein